MKVKKLTEANHKNNILCYKTKDGDELLAYYTSKPEEDAEFMNKEKPNKLPIGWELGSREFPRDWSTIDYFFADYQDPNFFD